MRAFDYIAVTSASEASQKLAAGGSGAMLIAGGADALSLLKSDLIAPDLLIDLKPANELRGVSALPDGAVRLGALTTLTDIERDETLAARLPILRQAVREAATPQLRNVATVGGNLLQRTRCWYYRGPYECWLKGGNTCFARDGQNKYQAIFDQSPCVSAHPSDLAPALIALDAQVTIQGPMGERATPLAELLRPPVEVRRREVVLEPTDVVTAVIVPPQPTGANGVFLKMMDRHAWAYALVSAAAQIALSDGVVTYARIVLGAVANTPVRLEKVESRLTGARLTVDLAREAADLALEGATPLEHNHYKAQLARELTRRAILLAGGMDW
jgi:xanthine dehydrogenase YagS FAD-binding subunit